MSTPKIKEAVEPTISPIMDNKVVNNGNDNNHEDQGVARNLYEEFNRAEGGKRKRRTKRRKSLKKRRKTNKRKSLKKRRKTKKRKGG